jgi:hypothetical protein
MKKFIVLLVLSAVISANPIMIKVLNEFQTAPGTQERIELKWFRQPSSDTVYGPSDLYGVSVVTPAGTAVVDTHLILPGNGFAVIDSSVLNGPFYLADNDGYIKVSQGWRDTLRYPSEVPAPPYGTSCALFYCYKYDPFDGYWMYGDWYIDGSPTFGAANDNYPGCVINGHVYDASANPISGAQVVVNAPVSALSKPPYYNSCTTYTAADGWYKIDSLLPLDYWVKVVGVSYFPDSQHTQQLTCQEPTTVNFYLIGIAETVMIGTGSGLSITPNPFRTTTNISIGIRVPLRGSGASFQDFQTKSRELRIYDAAGRLIRSFTLGPMLSALCWNGYDQQGQSIPPGVYFVRLGTAEGTAVKKIIKTK